MKRLIKAVITCIIGLLLLLSPINCVAYKRVVEKPHTDFDISKGSILIYCNKDGKLDVIQKDKKRRCKNNIRVSGETKENNINIIVDSIEKRKLDIMLDNLYIDLPERSSKAAIYIRNHNQNSIVFSLKNVSEIRSGKNCAGIDINNHPESEVVFSSHDGPRSLEGKLIVFGGSRGAGIGGGYNHDGKNIRFTGGTIISTGGENAAGIGGGRYGDCDNISISSGNIFAYCGERYSERHCLGAGIGGGYFGNCKNVTVSGGSVVAVSSIYAAGIGGGYLGSADNINVTGGTIIASGKSDISTSVGCGLGTIDESNININLDCFTVSKESIWLVLCYILNVVAISSILIKLLITLIQHILKNIKGKKDDLTNG